MGRYSDAQTQANRKRIISEAGRLLRERGLDGVGVADLMASAGLTHGGFYRHFSSKYELAVVVSQRLADQGAEQWHDVGGAARAEGRSAIEAIINLYLSPEHRDAPGRGCIIAALGSDLTRLPPAERARVALAVDRMIEALAKQSGGSADVARQEAVFAYSAMVGALTLARIGVGSDQDTDVLRVVCNQLKLSLYTDRTENQ